MLLKKKSFFIYLQKSLNGNPTSNLSISDWWRGGGWGGGVGGGGKGINQAFMVSAIFTVSLGCMSKSHVYPTLYFKLDKMHS